MMYIKTGKRHLFCAVFVKQRENLTTLYCLTYILLREYLWIRLCCDHEATKRAQVCTDSTDQPKTSEELTFFIRQSSADSVCTVWICRSVVLDPPY